MSPKREKGYKKMNNFEVQKKLQKENPLYNKGM